MILTDTLDVRVPAVEVEVVDTTGAGDAFNSGFAVALAEGRSVRRGGSLRRGLRGHRMHQARRGSGPSRSGAGGRRV